MRKMKKALATVLAATMVMGMSSTAWATVEEPKTGQNASFTKTYKITNAGTANPEETFTFTFTLSSSAVVATPSATILLTSESNF